MSGTDTQGAALPHSIAHLTATRTCRFETEPPMVIEHREALAYMLHEAAEIEHLVMCQYLFAAFSLKRSTDEGVTAEQLAAIRRWRKTVMGVAKQEMLHFALAQNLLVAIGWAPHFERPSLPAPAHHFPPGVQFALLPFGERALRHFLFLERPEGISIDDADGFEAVARAQPYSTHAEEEEIVPHPQDFSTVGHLYHAIVQGFERLVEKHGESRVFVGPPEAQATAEMFGWPELTAVVDLASAKAACETIVEQGEGASGEWRTAHFGRFHDIYDELLEMLERDPGFAPARPSLAGIVRPISSDLALPLIDDHTTSHVADLFNVVYEVLLQVLARFFVQDGDGGSDRRVLADVAVGLMFDAIDPLGELLTRMPFGPIRPEATAGPTFELFFESGYLFPHRRAAWVLLEERLREAAEFARRIEEQRGTPLAKVTAALDRHADRVKAIAGA
ncbi:MAG: ferritin-like domain-containing protein [Candidatus Limnocylindria bacterium]